MLIFFKQIYKKETIVKSQSIQQQWTLKNILNYLHLFQNMLILISKLSLFFFIYPLIVPISAWSSNIWKQTSQYLLSCATGAAADASTAIGSSPVFCNEWLFMCAWFFAFVDSLVADRSVLAAWMLQRLVLWGESRRTKPYVFRCKVASAGDGSYLILSCAKGAAADASTAIGSFPVFCNEWLFMCAWFFAFVDSLVADRSVLAAWMLHGACVGGPRMIPPLCSAMSGCQWLQMALQWLRQGCLAPWHNTIVFCSWTS